MKIKKFATIISCAILVICCITGCGCSRDDKNETTKEINTTTEWTANTTESSKENKTEKETVKESEKTTEPISEAQTEIKTEAPTEKVTEAQTKPPVPPTEAATERPTTPTIAPTEPITEPKTETPTETKKYWGNYVGKDYRPLTPEVAYNADGTIDVVNTVIGNNANTNIDWICEAYPEIKANYNVSIAYSICNNRDFTENDEFNSYGYRDVRLLKVQFFKDSDEVTNDTPFITYYWDEDFNLHSRDTY